MQEVVAALSGVQIDFIDQIKIASKDESMHQKLMKEIEERVI